jgi:signal transduction histidine kinase
MIRLAVAFVSGLAFTCCIGFGAQDSSNDSENSTTLPVVTNVLQFDFLAERQPYATFACNLAGTIRWVGGDGRLVALDDNTGAALVELEPQTPALEPGEAVLVTGDCSVNGSGAGIRIGARRLTDNQGGKRAPAEIYLHEGKHLLRVSWLAGAGTNELEVDWRGPSLPLQKVSDDRLFRRAVDNHAVAWANGLDCQMFEGIWPGLPDFEELTATRSVVTKNFELNAITGEQNGALKFSGYIAVPQDGLYDFSLQSPQTSELFIDLPQVKVTGTGDLRAPHHPVPGQALPPRLKSIWAKVDGVITFISRKGLNGYELELTSGNGRLSVEVPGGVDIPSKLVTGIRVAATGICRSVYTVDGQIVAGVLWVPDTDQLTILEPASRGWQMADTNSVAGQLPILTTLGQIMHMKREEAMQSYPVRIRGVVVWSGGGTCQICDSTGGIYVDARQIEDPDSLPIRAGDYLEIEGNTEVRFSPVIVARRAVRLGLGAVPEPAHPTMDQLLNGTLDAQYLEIEGIVTAVETNRLTMLTRSGKLQVYLVPPMWEGEPSRLTADASIEENWSDAHMKALKSYEGALVRVRGSLSPVKNPVTLQFKVGEIQMRAASVDIDQPAPVDPFNAPMRRASELLMFDPGANVFQPVKVSGQIIQERDGEFYMMDGDQGLRFTTKRPMDFAAGDLVEVVGFPELGAASPELREADARKIGTSALPRPERMVADAPLVLNASLDSTRVELQAKLMSSSVERNEQVLGLQMSSRYFLGRLEIKDGVMASIPVGSLLDLTGVYAAHIGGPGQGVDSFELLLNSPADIQVLARPSWWTLKRMMAVVGVLVAIIAGASLWISLLRRQVEQRTMQLRREIHEREQIEQQHAIEAERSRIARDLHDDLGSSLTEISLLADAGAGSLPNPEKAGNRFRLISQKSRSLVNALDLIVWLINPGKDSLPCLATYLGGYTEEYLSASSIVCRLKIPLDLPPLHLSAETRQSLFLAVKETLNNAVHHACASEVTMELSMKGRELKIAITDNGCGFDPAAAGSGNGIGNLHDRLARLGGDCQIRSGPDRGTTVSLSLPLAASGPVSENGLKNEEEDLLK